MFTAHARPDRELIWTPDTTLYFPARVAFEHVRVVDCRDTRNHIGWLRTGALNRYGSLTTVDSLHTELSAYANRLLKTARRQQGELIVVLRAFWLEDRKGGEEIGTAHLRADLFRSTGADAYWHVRSLDTFYETKSGLDVTAAVKRLGSQSIADMLVIGSGPLQSTRTYALAEMNGRQSASLDQWPVFTSSPSPGLYRTVDDFLGLKPSGDLFVMNHNRGANDGPEYRFFYLNAKGKRGKEIRPDGCFAIFDGKMWYLAQREGFSKMPQQAREFYAAQPLQGLTDNSMSLGLAYGLAGSLIASADRGKHYTWYVTRLDPEQRRWVPVKRMR